MLFMFYKHEDLFIWIFVIKAKKQHTHTVLFAVDFSK